jgi:cellulose synthase/poly-beta-1,6-N-acetylglucosamine synthase-like glycosyltransferase
MIYLFWISILTILYTYLVYPLTIYLISRFYKKPVLGKYIYPTVSIIMSAHNEEKNIENKARNLLGLDYPQARMEILIGSDGSTDATNQILNNSQLQHFVKVYFEQERKGKPSMLNKLVSIAQNEILVFTDARQILNKSAIKELVKAFADPKIGSVSAELHLEGESSQTARGVGLYWNYEKMIRKAESRIGSMLGATGALYAVRKELFPQLPKDLILDDIYIPMHAVQKGYRVVFDKKAKIYDRFSRTAKEEFLRKIRTLAGNFQLFLYFKWLFNPLASIIGWQFISHKFLRLLVPFLLAALFLSSWHLRDQGFYAAVSILQCMFYAFAILGMFFKHKSKFFDIAYMFCVLNAAAVVGMLRFLFNKQNVLWERMED